MRALRQPPGDLVKKSINIVFLTFVDVAVAK